MSVIQDDLNWLKVHAILLLAVGGLTIAGVYGVETLIAKHDEANNAKTQALLQAQVQQTQAIAAQLANDEKSWQQQNTAYQNIISQLSATISQRNKDLTAQTKKDSTLSANEAAQRIALQTHAAPGEVVAISDNVQIDLPISRAITISLDQLPALQSNLSDTQKQLESETMTAQNLQKESNEKQNLIDSMTIQEVDADKACKSQIAVLKSQSRKSKLKWFLAGLISGLIGGHWL